jgi:hypothetical protein
LWNLGGVVGLTVDGAPFFLGEPENNGWDTPTSLGNRTVRVEVFVQDPDRFIERAVAAGAVGSIDEIRNHKCRGEYIGKADSSIHSATYGLSVTARH